MCPNAIDMTKYLEGGSKKPEQCIVDEKLTWLGFEPAYPAYRNDALIELSSQLGRARVQIVFMNVRDSCNLYQLKFNFYDGAVLQFYFRDIVNYAYNVPIVNYPYSLSCFLIMTLKYRSTWWLFFQNSASGGSALFTRIYNLRVNSATFPGAWKHARVWAVLNANHNLTVCLLLAQKHFEFFATKVLTQTFLRLCSPSFPDSNNKGHTTSCKLN